MNEVKILSASGQLGYGFTKVAFQEGLNRNPDFIGVDAGSTDGGPAYLGSGKTLASKRGVKRDLSIALAGALSKKVPLIIGSAGTAGAKTHLEWFLNILQEINIENDYHYKLAVIYSDQEKTFLKNKLREGKIKPLNEAVPKLTEQDIDDSVNIVGQMGLDPIMEALKMKADVIVAGRSTDCAIYTAFPYLHGFDLGLAIHMAKILECGAQCSIPAAGRDSMWAILRKDHFILEPLHPIRHCTPFSIAAHTMYEQPDPYEIYEPEGMADLYDAKFEQINKRSVRVSGSKFIPAKPNTIKIEGSKKIGYRAFCIAGVRDPIMINRIEEVKSAVINEVKQTFDSIISPDDYKINFRIYGKNAVLGDIEFVKEPAHELGVIVEVVAKTQDLADSICAITRSGLLHCNFEGRKTTSGNVAFPYSPADIQGGEAYEFSIYHLLEVDDPLELFPIKIKEV